MFCLQLEERIHPERLISASRCSAPAAGGDCLTRTQTRADVVKQSVFCDLDILSNLAHQSSGGS